MSRVEISNTGTSHPGRGLVGITSQLLKQTPQIAKNLLATALKWHCFGDPSTLSVYPTQTAFAPILKQIALSSVEHQMKWRVGLHSGAMLYEKYVSLNTKHSTAE